MLKSTVSAPRVSPKTAAAVILLLLVLATALRFFMLSKQSLWLDEFLTWDAASGTLRKAILGDTQHPPLHYVITHIWVQWFGTTEAGLRSVNVIPSVLSIWLIYALGRRLFNTEIGLMGAFYQTISSFHIYYAQEARTYAFLVFFLLAASLALWNALEEEHSRRWGWYACYTAAMTLALYSHFIAIFFLGGHGLFVLVRKTRRFLEFLPFAAAAVAFFGPWLVIMLRSAAEGGQPFRRHLLLKLPQAYFSFFFGDSLIPLDAEAVAHIGQSLRSAWPILAAAIFSLAILAAFGLLAWKRWTNGMAYALMMASAPVLAAFLVSFKLMLFDERYLIGCSPFLYLAIAAAIWEIVLWPKERPAETWQPRAGWTAVAVYGALLSISLYQYYFVDRFGKEQWRDAVAFVESSGANDFIVFEPDYIHYCYDYYQNRRLPYLEANNSVYKELLADPASLAVRARGAAHLWLVRSHNDDDVLLKLVQGVFPEVSHRDFPRANGITVHSFALPAQ